MKYPRPPKPWWKPAEPMRGKWHISGGWLCDCRTRQASYFSNLHSANTYNCKRCEVTRPLKHDKPKKPDTSG